MALAAVTALIVAIPIVLLWHSITPEAQSLVSDIVKTHPLHFVVPAILLLFLYGYLIEWFYHFFVTPLDQLKAEIDLISTVNPSRRIKIRGNQDIAHLAERINLRADQYQELENRVHQKIETALQETEIEKNILASIVRELPEGMLICNAEGRIILYNREARRILPHIKKPDPAGATAEENGNAGVNGMVGIGRDIGEVIDRHLISHVTRDIRQRLEDTDADPATSFVMVDKQQRLYRVEAVPILNPRCDYKGFILVFYNITEDLENDTKIIRHLNAFMAAIRGKLAAIRSSAELLTSHQITNEERLGLLTRIIRDESSALSEIVNQGAFDFSLKIKDNWPLTPVSVPKLVENITGKMESVAQVDIRVDIEDQNVVARVDLYAITISVCFLLLMLIRETATSTFECRTRQHQGALAIIFSWRGPYVSTDIVEKWLERPPEVGREKIPLTLGAILESHEVEFWPCPSLEDPEVSCLYLNFPLIEKNESRTRQLVTVPTEERPIFYDFDLFDTTKRNPDLDRRLLKDLQFTVFDTETTGLDPKNGDEIVSIAAVRIVNQRLLREDVYDQLVRPSIPPTRKSIQVHGITPQRLRGQPTIKEVLPEFKRFAGDTVLVAHNAAFDMCFIEMQEKRTGIRLENPVLDTMLLSEVVHPVHPSHSLEQIGERLGVRIEKRHTALGDALTAGEIFLKLIELLAVQGIYTFGDAVAAARKTYLARVKY
jgi:DNA polymerase-3 subunit epsilon